MNESSSIEGLWHDATSSVNGLGAYATNPKPCSRRRIPRKRSSRALRLLWNTAERWCWSEFTYCFFSFRYRTKLCCLANHFTFVTFSFKTLQPIGPSKWRDLDHVSGIGDHIISSTTCCLCIIPHTKDKTCSPLVVLPPKTRFLIISAVGTAKPMDLGRVQLYLANSASTSHVKLIWVAMRYTQETVNGATLNLKSQNMVRLCKIVAPSTPISPTYLF